MAKTVTTLNLENNSKVDYGFEDILGVSDIANPVFDVISMKLDKAEGFIEIEVSIKATNVDLIRVFKWEAGDLSAGAKTKALDMLNDGMSLLLTESEFNGATDA